MPSYQIIIRVLAVGLFLAFFPLPFLSCKGISAASNATVSMIIFSTVSQTLYRENLTITWLGIAQCFVVSKCNEHFSIFDAGTSTKLQESYSQDGKENGLAMTDAVS